MHMSGKNFNVPRGGLITPIDAARRGNAVFGLGAINVSQPTGPKPTINPNAVVKLQK